MTRESCRHIRQAIETRNFINWQGLSPDCSAQELFTDIPPDVLSTLADRPTRKLGDDFRSAAFVLLDLAGYYRPMTSFRDQQLILFDAMNPELEGGFVPLYNDLGEPTEKLDWHYGTLAIPSGEWVYAKRGITVFLNTTADKALHVALYQPTTAQEYQRVLRPHLQKKTRPKRSSSYGMP